MPPSRLARAAERLRTADGSPKAVRAAQALRRLLPGDTDYGDPLSVAGEEPPHRLGQRLAALTAERPSALREVGLGTLQLWQSLAESQGRGHGDRELAILFVDLVEFSDWALRAGDDAALELLRELGTVIDPVIRRHEGRIVKRLGDGLMAVFDDAAQAVEAAIESGRRAREIEVEGYRAELRAGVHLGTPRRLGGDYFGVDVNVAARVADAAGPGEVLV